jgi:hypothetical protein
VGALTRPRLNGRRGAFQVVMGVVYLVVGSSFFFMPGSANRAETFRWLTPYIPLAVFAALWIIAGAVALFCSFLPRPLDATGFMALVFAPAIWFGLFAISAIVNVNISALVSGIIYGAFGAVPLIVSGMEGPRDRDHREVIR